MPDTTPITRASPSFEKLKAKLRELFELDKADLDFGIYRILRQRHTEITEFLDKHLEKTVREALTGHGALQQQQVKEDLHKAEAASLAAGITPEQSPRVMEVRAKLDHGANLDSIADEIYSHLLTFFSRYYQGGDFLGLQRSTVHGREKYVIPYNGEEVKLVWANMDQYYIKSSELLRDYTFHIRKSDLVSAQTELPLGDMPAEVVVNFKLIEGDTQKDNLKPEGKVTRAFALDAEAPFEETDAKTLCIRFLYREQPSERNLQDKLNADTEKTLADCLPPRWRSLLFAADLPYKGKDKKDTRTILAKHLRRYTAKFLFDYFIHKDLGGFLRRELDFYVKNEVMYLDDIEGTASPKAEEYLSKVRAIRRCAMPIIRMLAQLEDFQKKLWLKKKFVVETRYCLTLDRVPVALYPEVCAAGDQWKEWEDLYTISELKPKRTPEFLKANPYLMLDTRHFERSFTLRLLAEIDNIDDTIDGTCFHSENFQALQLMQEACKERVKCIYIDPPYNTSASAIPYKNDYKHSSWGTLMRDRLELMKGCLKTDGAIFVSIDKNERSILDQVMNVVFGSENKVEELVWVQNTNDGRSPTYSTNHEYVEVFSKNIQAVESDVEMFREPKPGCKEVKELILHMNPTYPPLSEVEKALAFLYESHKKSYQDEVEADQLDYEEEKRNDPWKGVYSYQWAEYRNKEGRFVPEEEAANEQASIWVYTESDWTIMSSESKQSETTKDPGDKNYRYYTIVHPVSGKPCKPPSRGWKGTQFIDPDNPNRNSLESLMNDHRIAFGPDENKVPRQKRFLHEVETNVCKSVFTDYSDGEKETSALFGKAGVFLAPKHTKYVARFLAQGGNARSIFLDVFGGSGSTAHAVIDLNRGDSGSRKYITAEVGDYFERILVPRLKKAVYAREWKSGKPKAFNTGISHAFKILRLEGYEDTLNNLHLRRTPDQEAALSNGGDAVRDQYMLGYFLDVESAGSKSLLDLAEFRDPFGYKLQIATSSAGQTKETTVDLVETFNWLLGLKVKHVDAQKAFLRVTGEKRAGGRTLVIWRTLSDDPLKDNEALEKFLTKLAVNPADTEYDFIYVNGSHTLTDPHNKVHLIEETFQRLMFDTTTFESLSDV